MNDVNYILHKYASKYYDPVKAHEYYMRTRELKGRSTRSLTDTGKDAWAYTKDQIGTEKKSVLESVKKEREKKIEQVRARATKMREDISSKLKAFNSALMSKAAVEKKTIDSSKDYTLDRVRNNTKATKDQLAAQKNSAIKRLMAQEIPKGVSKYQRARMINARNEKIDKLRGDYSSETSKLSDQSRSDQKTIRDEASTSKGQISEDVKTKKTTEQKTAAEKRTQVATELKTAITAARNAYSKSRESINSSYESIYQKEYASIKSKHTKSKDEGKAPKKKYWFEK